MPFRLTSNLVDFIG